MIKLRRFPARLRMTLLAAPALLAGMNVVSLMARYAVRFWLLSECVVSVAAAATNFRMLAQQGILGVLRVIKARLVPLCLHMAGAALRTKRATMDVIFGVTPTAIGRWSLVL
jgi:hypothetical protein